MKFLNFPDVDMASKMVEESARRNDSSMAE